MSNFFDPFPIQILPPKSIPTDFPLFSNRDNLYFCRKSGIGQDYAETPWFWDNWGWQRWRPGGENSHRRTKSSLSGGPSISSVNLKQITITLVPFVKPQLMVAPFRGGGVRRKYRCLQNLSLPVSQFPVLIGNFTWTFVAFWKICETENVFCCSNKFACFILADLNCNV